MIQQTPQAELFKQQLRDSLQRETQNIHAVKIGRHANVYTCGDQDEMVYFIESGQIKLLMVSSFSPLTLLHNSTKVLRHNNQPTPIPYDNTVALKIR